MAGSASDAPLCKGCRVRIAGLKGRPDLNGQEGDIIGDVNELERWPLKLDSGEKVKVKTGNLEVLDGWPGSDEDEEMEDKKGYDQLEDIDSLTELDLSCEERCGGQLLEVIGQRGLKLESLTLDFCANISDEALGFLRRLPRLKSLSLRSCDALSDAGLILMADPQMAIAEDAAAQPVQRGLVLEDLCLDSMLAITDKGVKAIAEGFPRLRSLDLTNSFCTDEACVAIARGCPLISQLVLDCPGSPITDAGITVLARACPLEQLSLCGITNVSNRGVKEVAEEAGESLIAIDLGESDVSNGAVTKGLSGRCPKLCRLRLFACSRITDLALVSAATGLPSLEKIDLEGCDQCTQAGLAALRTGRPLIEILPPLNMGGVVV